MGPRRHVGPRREGAAGPEVVPARQKMRVFLDANLLFTAAHFPEGKTRRLIDRGSESGLVILTCTLAVEEARRNLAAKASPRAVVELEKILKKVDTLSTPATGHCPFPLASKDQPIFWAAQAGKTTHFLTGDLKDFGPFMNKPGKTGGILIQTVGEFIESLS